MSSPGNRAIDALLALPRCQAVLVFEQPHRAATAGRVCGATSTGERNGRHVCWLHQGAARPLQFDDMATEQSEAAE